MASKTKLDLSRLTTRIAEELEDHSTSQLLLQNLSYLASCNELCFNSAVGPIHSFEVEIDHCSGLDPEIIIEAASNELAQKENNLLFQTLETMTNSCVLVSRRGLLEDDLRRMSALFSTNSNQCGMILMHPSLIAETPWLCGRPVERIRILDDFDFVLADDPMMQDRVYIFDAYTARGAFAKPHGIKISTQRDGGLLIQENFGLVILPDAAQRIDLLPSQTVI